MPRKSFEQFMADAHDELLMYLAIAPHLAGAMAKHRGMLGYATSIDTFEVLTVKDTMFHPISANGDLWIVIYNNPAERGYALYRPSERSPDKDVCVPITIGEVIRTWNDEQKNVQREKIIAMLDMLSILKGDYRLRADQHQF